MVTSTLFNRNLVYVCFLPLGKLTYLLMPFFVFQLREIEVFTIIVSLANAGKEGNYFNRHKNKLI